MTCKAVFKAPWLVEFSIDPASDIPVDAFDDVGVNGLWNIEMEAILDWRRLCECVERFFLWGTKSYVGSATIVSTGCPMRPED